VVGGFSGPGDATRPAAWRSVDGRGWQPVRFAPRTGSYYGPLQVIMSVACAEGRVAMVGARSGGSHGNPRVSTWKLAADGAMTEVDAPFETYGGERAVNVGQLAAGPAGFLIAGNRSGGAAVWLSPDGSAFRLREDAPGLASDAARTTVARDALSTPDGRWLVVGGTAPRGTAAGSPAAWLTRDGGRFTGVAVPASGGGFAELQRVVRLGADVVAVGPRGGAVGAWLAHDGVWALGGTFPGTEVQSVAVAHDALVAAGTPTALWRSVDGGRSWRALGVPDRGFGPSPPPDVPVSVAARPDGLLLAAGDRVWTAPA
jgi:hypothetical protein